MDAAGGKIQMRLKNRDTLAMTIHAEQNCVAYAARAGICLADQLFLCGRYLLVVTAGLLIQSDVTKIVVPNFVEPIAGVIIRSRHREMFIEAGVALKNSHDWTYSPAMKNRPGLAITI